MSLASSQKVTESQLNQFLNAGDYQMVWLGPSLTDGTRIGVRGRDGTLLVLIVTDWAAVSRFPSSTFKVERMGKASGTIVANATGVTVNVALSPVLPDVIGNYEAFATLNANVGQFVIAIVTATNNLQIVFGRQLNTPSSTSSVATGITVAGNPLTDVSGMALAPIPNPTTVSDAHGQSAFFNHAHDTVGHPVTDPQHNHAITLSAGAITPSCNWLILHV